MRCCEAKHITDHLFMEAAEAVANTLDKAGWCFWWQPFNFSPTKNPLKLLNLLQTWSQNLKGSFFNSKPCATHVDGLDVALLGRYWSRLGAASNGPNSCGWRQRGCYRGAGRARRWTGKRWEKIWTDGSLDCVMAGGMRLDWKYHEFRIELWFLRGQNQNSDYNMIQQ